MTEMTALQALNLKSSGTSLPETPETRNRKYPSIKQRGAGKREKEK